MSRQAPQAMGSIRKAASSTRDALLDAAEEILQEQGLASMSTRKVAERAASPLSQIHYHFKSKDGLMLALLDRKNRELLHRQESMFMSDALLSRRWETACDYLDDDLASGYVRILQEMIAIGWSNPDIAKAVRDCLRGWYSLLTEIAGEAAERFGGLGGLEPDDVASLVGNAFLGGEAMLLLGFEDSIPVRRALRRIGPLIRRLEEQPRQAD